MGFLKGLGTAVCGLLLFLALTIFSTAYMVHGTALSPGFINKQVNRVEAAQILDDEIKVNDPDKGNISQETKDTIIRSAASLEPLVKEQINAAVDRVFKYINGKDKDPQLAAILYSTVAGDEFITAAINEVDVAALVNDIVNQSKSENPSGFSRDIWDEVNRVLADMEPQLKAAVSAAVTPVNDYLWGQTSGIDLADVLSRSVLDKDFVNAVINEVNAARLAKDYINTQLRDALSQQTDEFVRYIDDNLDTIITRLEPWIKEQLLAAAGPSIDYLLGKSNTLNVTVSVTPAVNVVRDVIHDAFLAAPPPELAGMSQTELEQQFNLVFAEYANSLPATFSFDDELLREPRADFSKQLADGQKDLADARNNITKAMNDAKDPMSKAQHYLGLFNLGYWLLIIFMVVMAGLMFLINRNIRTTARALGIDLLIFGVFDLAGSIIAMAVKPSHFFTNNSDIPASVMRIADNAMHDAGRIGLTFSIGVLVIAIALLVVSFVVKPRQAQA